MVSDLHHRHYRTWGREEPKDVMLVCRYCHQLIEYLRAPDGRPFHPESLGARGDDGHTDTAQWRGGDGCPAAGGRMNTT